MDLVLRILLLPDTAVRRFERAVAHVRCAWCGHPRARHRHHRAELDCGGCPVKCGVFRWPPMFTVALRWEWRR